MCIRDRSQITKQLLADKQGLQVNRDIFIDFQKQKIELLRENVLNKGATDAEILKLTSDARKAFNSTAKMSMSGEVKGMSAWDFDDTLARTQSDVLFTAPDGTKGKLNATEFAKQGDELLKQGYVFDFSEFNKVTKGKPGPFLKL